MALFQRSTGVLLLILASLGIVACIAGVVGVWIVFANTSSRVTSISEKVDAGLERVSTGNNKVRRALDRAREDVAEVRKGSTRLGTGTDRNGAVAQALRIYVREQAGPNLNELSGRLITLSDTAVAVSALLDSAQDLRSNEDAQLTSEELEEWSAEARQLSGILRRLETAVGSGEVAANPTEIADATGEVDRVLQRCQARVDGWQSDLDSTREDVRRARENLIGWLTTSAVVVTVLLVWIGAGQVSLLVHGRRWSRSSGSQTTSPEVQA